MPRTVTLPLCSRTKASPFWIILLLVSRRDIVCKGLAQERRRGAAGSRSPGSPITGRTVASIDDRARRVSRVGLTALLGRFVLLGALARQPASGASSPGASLPAARPGAPAGVPEWGSQRADEAKPVRVAIGKPDNRRAGPMVNGNPWPPRVFRVVADFDGSTKRYVGHGRPSKIIGLQGVSLASRGPRLYYPLRAIERATRRSARATRANLFAAMASRYGASASRSARVIAAENSPTMVTPRLVRTGRTSNWSDGSVRRRFSNNAVFCHAYSRSRALAYSYIAKEPSKGSVVSFIGGAP